ncbi:DUF6204 family protein [Blastococcus sp. SYSU D00820]
MSTRTYRVIVRGVFDGLDESRRAQLLERVAEHDLFAARFTEEGSLTYDASLSAFSHRSVVRVDPGPGEEDDAHAAGQLLAMACLDAAGVGHRRLRSTVTCMDDVKVRRR